MKKDSVQLEVTVDMTEIDEKATQLVKLLKEANSLADELASKEINIFYQTRRRRAEMEYKEWEKQRTAALEAFREFLKTLPGNGFTLRQLEMIGNEAKNEVENVITDIKEKLVLTEDLTDLLKQNHGFSSEVCDTK